MHDHSVPIPQTAFPISTAGVRWLKLAVLYLLIGVVLGIAMGATETFTLRPVHAHLNLLGWTTIALAGLIYSVFPAAGETRLAAIHFWLHNLALPVMMGALTAMLLGHAAAVPFLVASEFVLTAGLVAFVLNIFLNLHGAPRPSAGVNVSGAARGSIPAV